MRFRTWGVVTVAAMSLLPTAPVFGAESGSTDASFSSFLKTQGFVTLSAGALFQSAGASQNINLTPTIERAYAAETATKTFANAELFFGVRQRMTDRLVGQFGIAVARSSGALLRGSIYDDADPAFDNFTYQYRVTRTFLALKNKTLIDVGMPVTPWVSVSAGLGVNSSHDFTSQGKDFDSVPGANFADQSTTVFSYALGVGFQYDVAPDWKLGFGYEYSVWGKSQLGAAAGQTSGTGLVLPRLSTSGFLLNLTFSS